MPGVTVRPYAPSDAEAAAQVFFTAVREGARGAYSAEQRAAWAPEPPQGAAWRERLAGQHVVVAERDGALVGFMTLQGGHLDLAYVAPDEMGRGTAGLLYDAVLAEARRRRLVALTTDASHLAKRFFEKRGWRVVRAQEVERRGVTLVNFAMTLDLGD